MKILEHCSENQKTGLKEHNFTSYKINEIHKPQNDLLNIYHAYQLAQETISNSTIGRTIKQINTAKQIQR